MPTGKDAATKAAKQLRRNSSTPAEREVAGSDLVQTKKIAKPVKKTDKKPTKRTRK
jgi:hypothetical protein